MTVLDVRGLRVEARWPQGGHLLFLDDGLVEAALASLEAGQRFEYIRAPVGEDLVVSGGRVYYRSGGVWRSVESPDPVAWTTLYLLMAVLGAPRSRLLSVRRSCLEQIIESLVDARVPEPLRVTLHPYYTVRRDGKWARLVLAEGLSVVAGRWGLKTGLDTLLLVPRRGRPIIFVDVDAGEVEGLLRRSLGVEVARVERRLWMLDDVESPVYVSVSARITYALLDEEKLGEVLSALGFTIPHELLDALSTRINVEVVGVTPLIVHDIGWADEAECEVLVERVKRGDFEKLYILNPEGALDEPVLLPAHRLVYMPVDEAEALLLELLDRIDESSDTDLDDEWLEGPRRIGAAVLEAVEKGGERLVECLEERVDARLFGVNRRFYDVVKALVSRGEGEALAWLVARVSAVANECMEEGDDSPRCAYMLLTSAQAAYITYNLLRCQQGLGEREGGDGKDAGAAGAG